MAGAVRYAGRQASVGERLRELLAVLSRPGPPSPGLPALRGGFVVFHFGKGWGWGREGQDPEGAGRARVRDPRLPEAARTVETMNHPVTARERPTGPASPASSPGLRGRAARGAGWARGRGRGRVGEDFAPSQVARWAARPGADPGRPWAGEPADAAPGLLSKV